MKNETNNKPKCKYSKWNNEICFGPLEPTKNNIYVCKHHWLFEIPITELGKPLWYHDPKNPNLVYDYEK